MTYYEYENCTSPVHTETLKSFACVKNPIEGYNSYSYGDPPSTSSSVRDKSCFAGTEIVNMESGGSKFISDLRVGDRVEAADAFGVIGYSEVMWCDVMW